MQNSRPALTRLEAAALCAVAAALLFLLYSPLAAAITAARSRGFAPNDACVGNMRVLAVALVEYEQDSDELLPPMHTIAQFQAALLPFAKDPNLYVCPDTGLPYTPNAAISNQPITSFADPQTVEVLRDTKPHADGLSTVLFLDNHIERGGKTQGGGEVGDPSLLCVKHANLVSLGVLQYTQDYDETLPPTKTPEAFRIAVFPYVRSYLAFFNPVDGKPFIPNPAISGVSLASINDPAHTILFQTAAPLPDGVPVIAYVDGHVTPAISSEGASGQDMSNLHRLMLGVIQYTQDFDEYLPTTTDYPTFKTQILPYVKDKSLFVSPDSGLPYVLNPAISGLPIADIPDPSTTEFMRDARRNLDGSLNIAFVDGHIQPDLEYVAQKVAVGPDDANHLFWRKADGTAALWTVDADGTVQSENAYTLPTGTAFSFSVGGDDKSRLLWSRSYTTFYPDGALTGQITLDTIVPGGTVEFSAPSGPYDGWTPLDVESSPGPDGSSHLLWRRYDNTLALWNVTPEGQYGSDIRLSGSSKLTFVGLAEGRDGKTRILWRGPGGAATVWTISPSGPLAPVTVFAPLGLTLSGLAVGPDNKTSLLWNGSGGRGQIWTLGSYGSTHVLPISLSGGGRASSLAIGAGGDLRVLWRGDDVTGRLQTLQANGTVISVHEFPAYP